MSVITLRVSVGMEIPSDRGGIEKAEMSCQRAVEGSIVISRRGRSRSCWTRAARLLRSLENLVFIPGRWATGSINVELPRLLVRVRGLSVKMNGSS